MSSLSSSLCKSSPKPVIFYYEDLFDNLPENVLLTNTQGIIIFANKNAEKIFGYPSLKEKSIKSLFTEQSCKVCFKNFCLLDPKELKGHILHSVQGLLHNGDSIPLRVCGGKTSIDDKDFITFAISKNEKSSFREDTLLRKISSLMTQELVMVCTPGMEILEINDWGATLLGYEREELIQKKKGLELLHNKDLVKAQTILSHLTEECTGKGYLLHLRCHRKDGSLLWLESMLRCQSNCKNQQATQIFWLGKESSEQKLQEEWHSSLLSSVYHDISDPLSASRFILRVLEGMIQDQTIVVQKVDEKKEGNDKQILLIDCMQKLRLSIGQSVQGIDDFFLDFGRLMQGDVTLEPVEFAVENLIEELISAKMPLAKQQTLQLCSKIAEDCHFHAFGDAKRIRQILLTYLDNAIRFTPKFGEIYLKVSKTKQTEAKVHLLFEVHDTGTGISAEEQAELFQDHILSVSRKRSFQGMGLGLVICKKLADLMHGTVGVKSGNNGGGTNFFFEVTLPFVKKDVIGIIEKKGIKWENALKKYDATILIADDNRVIGKSLINTMQKLGSQCDYVMDGKQLVEKMQNNSYDLIITDLEMPVMNGIEASKILREREQDKQKRVPILLFTACDLSEEEKKEYRGVIDDLIPKSAGPEQLFEACKKLLEVTKTKTI